MGKPTGFMEYKREVSVAEDPKKRIQHFNEFHEHLPKEKQRLQGARCMECGVPFCQSGRTAADDCYLFTGAYHRGLGCRIALAVGVFNDGIFVLLGGDRIPVQSAGTCCLTQGRTHSGSELGEIVGLLQTVVSLLPVAGIYQIVPLRHQIVQGASADHPSNHYA